MEEITTTTTEDGIFEASVSDVSEAGREAGSPPASSGVSNDAAAGNGSERNHKKVNVNRVVFIVSGLALPILSFLIFWLYVNFNTFILAFQKPSTYEWTLDNFVQFWDQLTRAGGTIGIALRNTLIYFAESVLLLFLNLIIAYFLYKKIFGYKVFRIIFYLPAIISAVVMTTVFAEFIKPHGPLGTIVGWFGGSMKPEGLLGQNATATWAIVAYNIWVGFTGMLLFHGALARIPYEIIEAAKLDGCGPIRECRSIIFPLVWPTFSTLLIFHLTGLFTASGPILLFTNGEFETTTISYWIFTQVYGTGAVGGSGNYGLVSAAGLCFTAVGLPIILLVRKLVEKIPVAEY